MSLRLGGWDRRLIQDNGGAVRKGGGWEVLPKRRGREELRHRRVERELIRDCSAAAAPGPRSMARNSDGRGRVLGARRVGGFRMAKQRFPWPTPVQRAPAAWVCWLSGRAFAAAGAVRKGGGWEVLSKRCGREELV